MIKRVSAAPNVVLQFLSDTRQIVNIIDVLYYTALNDYARSKLRLIAYAKRCDARIFGDEANDT